MKKDIFDDSFDIISESIRERIFNIQSNSKLKMALKTLEKFMLGNDNDSQNSEINKWDSSENHFIIDDFNSELNVSGNKDENWSGSSSFYKTNDNSTLEFRKALKNLIVLYDNVKQYSDVSKILRPPPVPVTELFRKHNPEASNIFDFHNTNYENQVNLNESKSFSNDMDKMVREAIHTCLIQPNHLKEAFNDTSLADDCTLNSLKISDSGVDSNYEMLRVLFGWYFSGYYTARMELLTQSD
ncbi:conserved hypothetical protein [Theileria orientalis strain Shintoku]|uniref:Uncharacterized protein n=1 Tax=Theileria orientalis strain Shintoku TaxID=869250 RepID=J4D767_THEOR|nr:conserved hypothetical protein [Theileria orientalis strain Shintoku]BAM39995.1 conserved hypothetical protein [Theileria orientalis strain Shintoku]|eukprot:XP_009690296.1 conserved hypothetical protein [Theileria orientalis strain Shintoku]